MIVGSQANEIRRLQRSLCSFIRNTFDLKAEIKPLGTWEDWSAVREETTVRFSIGYKDGGAMWRSAERGKGGKCPVFPMVSGGTHGAWAGWYEEWVSEGNKHFALQTASWSFFWGGAAGTELAQVARAEWAQHGPADAPQPHWNLDADVILPGFGEKGVGETGVDLARSLNAERVVRPDSVSAALSAAGPHLEDVHLGMAGWLNERAVEGCWRCKLDLGGLGEWAKRTLLHAETEFERLERALWR